MNTTQHYTYDTATNLVRRLSNTNNATLHYQPVHTTSNRPQVHGYDTAGNQQHSDVQSGWRYHADGSLAQLNWQADGYQYQEYYTYAEAGRRARKVTEVRSLGSGGLIGLTLANYVGDLEFRTTYKGTHLSYNGDKVTNTNGVEVAPISQRTITRIKAGHGQVGNFDKNELTGQQRISYQALNHIDSNELALDEEGNLSHYHRYASYGEIIEEIEADNTTSELGYSGQELDDSGLVYYGHRYLQTKSGIWNRADPIRFASGQLNLYSMLEGNPVRERDLYGLIKVSDLLSEIIYIEGITSDDLPQDLSKMKHVLTAGQKAAHELLIKLDEPRFSLYKLDGLKRTLYKALYHYSQGQEQTYKNEDISEDGYDYILGSFSRSITLAAPAKVPTMDELLRKIYLGGYNGISLYKEDFFESLQTWQDYWLLNPNNAEIEQAGKYIIYKRDRTELYGLLGAAPPAPKSLYKEEKTKVSIDGYELDAYKWIPNVRFLSKKEKEIMGYDPEMIGTGYNQRYKHKLDGDFLSTTVDVGKMLRTLRDANTEYGILGENDCRKWATNLQNLIRLNYDPQLRGQAVLDGYISRNITDILDSDLDPISKSEQINKKTQKLTLKLHILKNAIPPIGIGDSIIHHLDPLSGCDYHAATIVAKAGANLITLEAHAGKDLTVPHFHIRQGVKGFVRDNNTRYHAMGYTSNWGNGDKVDLYSLLNTPEKDFMLTTHLQLGWGNELIHNILSENPGGWLYSYAILNFPK